MAVDVVASPVEARPRVGLIARVAALPAWLVLSGLVAADAIGRFVGGLGHAVPLLLPDEYIYPSLARSLADHGRPLIRGAPAHFPALLEPLLAAPFWLQRDAVLAYRLTQGMHAVVISLAAIPAYLLARKLGLGKGLSLALAVVALSFPDLTFSSSMLAEPIAYPLALGTVYAAVRTLETPSRRAQLLFVALSGLATFARIQYVCLPLVLAAAALVVERGSIRRAFVRVRLAVTCFLVPPAVLLAALGPQRLLGPYSAARHVLHVGSVVHWSGIEAMLLAYAAGIVIVPGALVALGCGLLRPRTRAESAFAAVTVSLTAALLLESAFIADTSSHRFEERYLSVLLPLAALAFGVYVRRGFPRPRMVAGFSIALLLLSMRIPLSGYAVSHLNDESPMLYAVNWLEHVWGIGDAGLAIALVAALLALIAMAIAWRRRGGALALAIVVGIGCASSAFATVWDASNARTLRQAILPADVQWLAHTGIRDVALFQTPYSRNGLILETLFWNRNVTRLIRLASRPIDQFAADEVRVRPDGTLVAAGRPVRQPLLVEKYGSTVVFRNARTLREAPGFELVRPVGPARVALMVAGRFYDRWLAPRGAITVWPEHGRAVEGRLELTLALPPRSAARPLRLEGPGVNRTVEIAPGEVRTLTLPVSSCGAWGLSFSTPTPGSVDERRVSTLAKLPVFVPAARTTRSCG